MAELGRFRWFAGEDLVEPEEVWCPEVGYPHSDVKGRTQFENTHFDELRDAWARLHHSAIARARMAGRSVAAESTQARKGPS